MRESFMGRCMVHSYGSFDHGTCMLHSYMSFAWVVVCDTGAWYVTVPCDICVLHLHVIFAWEVVWDICIRHVHIAIVCYICTRRLRRVLSGMCLHICMRHSGVTQIRGMSVRHRIYVTLACVNCT